MVYGAPVLIDQYVQYSSRMNQPKTEHVQVSKVGRIQSEPAYREAENKVSKNKLRIQRENRKRHPNTLYSFEDGKGKNFQEYV